MVDDHDGPRRAIDTRPDDGQPLVLRLEPDGTGSASFDWRQICGALASGLQREVSVALGCDTHMLGIRFVDADGRAVNGPVPDGLALVGFSTPVPTNAPPKEADT